MPDYYNLLNLNQEASFIAIDDAYHRLTRLHAGDEVTLRLLREAFAVLSDPERRKEYDRSRGRSVDERAPGQARPEAGHPTTKTIDIRPPASRPSRPHTEVIDAQPPASRQPRPHTEVIDAQPPTSRQPRPHTEVIDAQPPASRQPRPHTEVIDTSAPGRPSRINTELFDAGTYAKQPEATPVPPGPIRVIVDSSRGQEATTCILEDGEHIIGRSSKDRPEPSVKLDGDNFVSRKHAVIIKDFGSLVILDNKSVNGTKLNGQRLVSGRPYPLNDGDIIEIEAFTLRVEFGAGG